MSKSEEHTGMLSSRPQYRFIAKSMSGAGVKSGARSDQFTLTALLKRDCASRHGSNHSCIYDKMFGMQDVPNSEKIPYERPPAAAFTSSQKSKSSQRDVTCSIWKERWRRVYL